MSSEDILDIDTDDVKDLIMLPEGKYEVTILDIGWKISENSGNKYLNVRMEANDNPLANDIYSILMHPDSADTEKQANRYSARIRDFKRCFALPSGPLNFADIKGKEGSIETRMEKDQQGEDKHAVRLFRPAR